MFDGTLYETNEYALSVDTKYGKYYVGLDEDRNFQEYERHVEKIVIFRRELR